MSKPKERVLLNPQRNELFICLQSKGFTPADFILSEEHPSALLRHRSTSYGCIITVGKFNVSTDGMGSLSTPVTVPFRLTYSPGRELLQEEAFFSNWNDLVKRFKTSELQTPDLWSTVSGETQLISLTADEDNRPFTPDEKLQVQKALNEIKAYLITIHNPSGTRLEAIEKRLGYLEEAVNRLGRLDWKGIFVNTLITIAVTESMSADSAKDLLRFAGQIVNQFLRTVLYLTGPH
jgi:hypothetical protein